MTNPTEKPLVLLVEDNLADVELVTESLCGCGIEHDLVVTRDGVEASDFLCRRDAHHRARRPSLVLLDLNLPRKSGKELLSEVKGDPRLRSIPIVVLTTSDADEDVEDAYRRHANAYVIKPLRHEELATMLRTVAAFWLGTARMAS